MAHAATTATEAWVTLATNDSYALGALTLGRSLRRVATSRSLVVMVAPQVSQGMRESLGSVFNIVWEVNLMNSGDEANLKLLKRPELGITFTKLNCWRLTQFTKCVFVDADTMVVQHCDELFNREEFSAAADVGWPDCFNSGVFVFRPDIATFDSLVNFALIHGSFDGGDQGLLNMFFSDWATKDLSKHLPFIYNMTSSSAYSYEPAFRLFKSTVKIVHFLGAIKPWMHDFNKDTGRVTPREGVYHALEHLQFWWDIFLQDVQPVLPPTLTGLAGQIATMSISDMVPGGHLDDRMRQVAWESGHVDYMGRDAFENIQRRIDSRIVLQDESIAESDK